MFKLNLGASPIWNKKGWYILDHKIKKNKNFFISGNAENMNLKKNTCNVVFCSHVFEHIPHLKLPMVIAEINRVMKKNSILRILTPDLEKICNAYVKKDKNFLN